ncbi:MAG: aldo/keto reductase [Pyrinomonadaceae bacterium]|nr:aldo/keto reductase [Pyrinomonadaceae bacterium]
MEYRNLGNTGLKVSRLGFGGAEIGLENQNQDSVERLLGSAIDAGLNLVDTAAAYLTSEELIGNALLDHRKDIVLISKCGAVDGFTRFDWSKDGILKTIERSLKLLQTDYLDIMQLHSCDAETISQGECIEALIVAKERGYIRFAGYSGDHSDAVAAIETDFFDTLQTSVSVADQEPIELTLPLAIEREMGVIAKRPVANAVWRHSELPEEPYHHEYWNRIEKLLFPFLEGPLGESVGHALRFTLSVEGVTTAIVGTTKPGRWEENSRYVGMGPLEASEFDSIRERWKEVATEDWRGQV